MRFAMCTATISRSKVDASPFMRLRCRPGFLRSITRSPSVWAAVSCACRRVPHCSPVLQVVRRRVRPVLAHQHPVAISKGGGSRVSTTSRTDFWAELSGAVQGLLGSAQGRSVVISPQAGIMAVRAMPDELRQVDKFLKAAQIAVERQVMLEAKIVEVELRDGYQ